jgi:hypothetical protein
MRSGAVRSNKDFQDGDLRDAAPSAAKEHGFADLLPIAENHVCEIQRQFSIRAVDYVACGPCGAKVELTGFLMLEKCSLFRMRCRMSA